MGPGGGSMLTSDHIEPEEALDFIDGRAGPETVGRVRAHLDTGCPRCQAFVRFWEKAVGALQETCAPEVPAWVRERLMAVGDRLRPRPSAFEQVVARLKLDSRLQPSLAGARGATEREGSFRLLLEAEGTDVDLLCEPEGDDWQITGQAMLEADDEIVWSVSAAGTAGKAEVDSDSLGIFRLRGLAPGVYDLVLRGSDREVVVRDLELGDED